MNFKIFCALTLVSGFLYFPKTNAAELQDANAQAELAAGTEQHHRGEDARVLTADDARAVDHHRFRHRHHL
mgnify:CR=1 FL=1